MAAFPSPERLARYSTRRPWVVIAAWLAVLVVAMLFVTRLGDALSTGAENFVTTESGDADDLLEERYYGRLPGNEVVVIQSPSGDVNDPAFRAFVSEVTLAIRGLEGDVDSVTNTFETNDTSLVSADGSTTILPVTLSGEFLDAEEHAKPLIALLDTFDGRDGFTVVTGGDGSTSLAFTETSESDLQTAEFFGIPIAMVILLIVFGALVAAGLPLLLGLGSIIVALGLAAIIGSFFDLSTFVVNFVTTMGMAVGIDYSLLVVQRFREERENGLSRDDAIVRAGATASRAVLFSGMAVIVALFGMVIVPQSIFRSLGIGAILVVAVAVLAALTLLPAVLRLLGDKVNAGRLRIPGRRQRPAAEKGAFWTRTTRLVMAHPWLSAGLSVGLLLAAAAPYLTIQLGWAGVSSLPQDSEARRAFEILDTEFSAGTISPTKIVVDGSPSDPDVQGAIDRLTARLSEDSRFGAARVETNAAGDLALITVPLNTEPQGDAALDAVGDLRGDYIPAAFAGTGVDALVTGTTAGSIDSTGVIEDYTIPVFAFVLGFSFIILLVVFRSIVVPVKALIMNLLSVGAAYGLMVLVFQHGIGNSLLGFQQVERIESWVPLFMFAVLFGLSMDYHVFLLSRIRERFEHTHDNDESVAFGVRSTAGMITGAAAIMIAVFGGFAAGEMVMFQQMGFGLAVAVLLDATIVRIVLVPASMKLLGERNWYLPAWLGWLPHVDVEGKTSFPAPKPGVMPSPKADPVGGK